MAPKFMCVLADGDLSNECRWLPCRSSPSIMMLMMKVMMMMMLLLTLPEQSQHYDVDDDGIDDDVVAHLARAVPAGHASRPSTLVASLHHPSVGHSHHPHLGRDEQLPTWRNMWQLEHTYNRIMIFFAITITNKVSTSSLNMLAGGSSISQGRGAPPRPGPSTSPPWQ